MDTNLITILTSSAILIVLDAIAHCLGEIMYHSKKEKANEWLKERFPISRRRIAAIVIFVYAAAKVPALPHPDWHYVATKMFNHLVGNHESAHIAKIDSMITDSPKTDSTKAESIKMGSTKTENKKEKRKKPFPQRTSSHTKPKAVINADFALRINSLNHHIGNLHEELYQAKVQSKLDNNFKSDKIASIKEDLIKSNLQLLEIYNNLNDEKSKNIIHENLRQLQKG